MEFDLPAFDRSDRLEKMYRSLSLEPELLEPVPPSNRLPFAVEPHSASNGNLAAGGAIPR